MNRNRMLIIEAPDGTVACKSINKKTITVGRHRSNDIVFNSVLISSRHGYFSSDEIHVYFSDNSTNGTQCNCEPIKKNEKNKTVRIRLHNGDKLTFPTKNTPPAKIFFSETDEKCERWKRFDVRNMPPEITIGRDKQSDIFLNDRCVSMTHACIKKDTNGIYLQDLSTYGSYVNKKKVSGGCRLQNGDVLFIGNCCIYYLHPLLLYPCYQKKEDPSAQNECIAIKNTNEKVVQAHKQHVATKPNLRPLPVVCFEQIEPPTEPEPLFAEEFYDELNREIMQKIISIPFLTVLIVILSLILGFLNMEQNRSPLYVSSVATNILTADITDSVIDLREGGFV